MIIELSFYYSHVAGEALMNMHFGSIRLILVSPFHKVFLPDFKTTLECLDKTCEVV